MSLTTKLLNPIRQSLSPHHYHSPISRSSQLLRCRFEPTHTWINQLSPSIRYRFTKFLSHCNRRNAYLSGSKNLLCAGSIIGVGFSPLAVAFAMDGHDVLVDDRDFSDTVEGLDWGGIWMVVRKMWVPVVFFVTVFMNWYHPVMLLAKVSLFLLTTKPTPLSVYIFVDRLCQQSMRRQPYLYFLKTLYAKKVEVEDYKLFCLATVEVRDQKFTLVGILGGWWAFPLTRETFSLSSALY